MKHYLSSFLIFSILLLSHNLESQQLHLDIDGDTRIRGKLDMALPTDSTSVIIGYKASHSDSSVGTDTFLGVLTGQLNLSGHDNLFLGYAAGQRNIEGVHNTYVGQSAGTFNSSGSNNVFLGASSGEINRTGSFNTIIGEQAGLNNTNGSYNTFVGNEAGQGESVGTRNTYLGTLTGSQLLLDSLDRAIAIGYNAKVDCSHCAVIGGTGEDAVNVGIGVSDPNQSFMLLSRNGTNPIGITQNNLGGGSSMELTTEDGLGGQATRMLLKGNGSNSDISFHRGNKGTELTTVIIKGSTGNVGINVSTPSAQLDVDGNARIRGVGSGVFSSSLNITSNGTLTTSTSDRRLKENITELDDSLEKIIALRGVSYNWKNDKFKEKRVGFIAQEVEGVVPELVFTNQVDGYKGVRYEEITAVLVEAIKTQQSEIEQLKNILSKIVDEVK